MSKPPKEAAPYIMRAKEMSQHDEVVEYFCLLRALEVSIPIYKQNLQDQNLQGFINQLFSQVEAKKAKINDMQAAKEHFEAVIDGIYSNVVKEDDEIEQTNPIKDFNLRKEQAKKFMSISHFIEVLPSLFGGQIPPDWLQKKKYLKYRALLYSKTYEEAQSLTRQQTGTFVPPPLDQQQQQEQQYFQNQQQQQTSGKFQAQVPQQPNFQLPNQSLQQGNQFQNMNQEQDQSMQHFQQQNQQHQQSQQNITPFSQPAEEQKIQPDLSQQQFQPQIPQQPTQNQQHPQNQPFQQTQAKQPEPVKQVTTQPVNQQKDLKRMQTCKNKVEVQKLLKNAISELDFNNAENAITNIQKALNLLTN